jgi:hypothetical protein
MLRRVGFESNDESADEAGAARRIKTNAEPASEVVAINSDS